MTTITAPHATIEVNPEEVWEQAFGTSGETWGWWVSIDFFDGATWEADNGGFVRLTITDPDDADADDAEQGTITKDVRVADVLAAVQTAVDKGYLDTCTGTPLANKLTEGDLDWDACTSDVVLQVAVLGDVIYG